MLTSERVCARVGICANIYIYIYIYQPVHMALMRCKLYSLGTHWANFQITHVVIYELLHLYVRRRSELWDYNCFSAAHVLFFHNVLRVGRLRHSSHNTMFIHGWGRGDPTKLLYL
jgi:hypothetical protein